MICAVSTKTTGLKAGIHEVIELSIKPLNGTEITYRVLPYRGEIYEENVQKINGVSLASAMAFPDRPEMMKSVQDMFPNGFQPMGHHLDFDFNMIKETFGMDFLKTIFKGTPINTALMLEKKNLDLQVSGKPRLTKNLALKSNCKALNIPFTTKCAAVEKLYQVLTSEA